MGWSCDAHTAGERLSRRDLLASALAVTTQLHKFMRDAGMARQVAEAAIAVSTAHGFPFELAVATFCRGWTLAYEGHLEEGIAEMRRAEADLEAPGFVQRWAAFLAEARAKTEGPSAGLKQLAEGALARVTRERFYEAERSRLKGDLLLMQ